MAMTEEQISEFRSWIFTFLLLGGVGFAAFNAYESKTKVERLTQKADDQGKALLAIETTLFKLIMSNDKIDKMELIEPLLSFKQKENAFTYPNSIPVSLVKNDGGTVAIYGDFTELESIKLGDNSVVHDGATLMFSAASNIICTEVAIDGDYSDEQNCWIVGELDSSDEAENKQW